MEQLLLQSGGNSKILKLLRKNSYLASDLSLKNFSTQKNV